jgi:hypothetical protein
MKGRAMKTIYKTIEMIRDYAVFAAVLVPTVLMVLAACVSLSKSAEYARPMACLSSGCTESPARLNDRG